MKIGLTLSLIITGFTLYASPVTTHRDTNILRGDTLVLDSVNNKLPKAHTNGIRPKFSYTNVKNYIFSHLSYPGEAIEADIEGTVIVSFVVTTKGKIDSIKIVQPVHPLLDNEALRLIRDMPHWKPVYVSGEPIELFYKVPVIFELKKEQQDTL